MFMFSTFYKLNMPNMSNFVMCSVAQPKNIIIYWWSHLHFDLLMIIYWWSYIPKLPAYNYSSLWNFFFLTFAYSKYDYLRTANIACIIMFWWFENETPPNIFQYYSSSAPIRLCIFNCSGCNFKINQKRIIICQSCQTVPKTVWQLAACNFYLNCMRNMWQHWMGKRKRGRNKGIRFGLYWIIIYFY